MNQIKAEIIADSYNEFGNRITTFILRFPRIILAEFNTHRMLSKNSASSRAIPFNKMLEMVQTDPFIPIRWMKDHKGMQGNEYLTNSEPMFGYDIFKAVDKANEDWLEARDQAIGQAIRLNQLGITKQVVNRLLEPFMWHTVLVTGTEWENFFALRDNEAAEIHMQDLAHKMLEAYNTSTPQLLKGGEWHIPFGDKIDESILTKLFEDKSTGFSGDGDEIEEAKIKIATARCARVSYNNFDGSDDYEKDILLHDRLSESGHWSPFEHCARSMTREEYLGYNHTSSVNYDKFKANSKDYHRKNVMDDGWLELASYDNDKIAKQLYSGWCGNFRGFIQYRKMFSGENKSDDRVIKIS